MNAVKVSLNPPFQEDAGHRSPEQMLSALVDGEVDDDQLAALFAPDQGAEDVLEKWHTYQLIGHVLRGDTAASEMTCRPGDFLAGVRGRLQTETMPVVPSQPPSVAARAPAANDAVFRWQLVAGMASLAAVMAVSWSVLSSAPGGPGAVDPQLAVAPASATVVATPPSPAVQPSTTVVVNTGQGPLIRDARLEELLAEHRQNGGMSALQMPTGFIRSATYDAAGR
ncbi:sigma-E factor negative regulatory protein [Hydrogenophaga sp. BPS33]|uniref:sigma-E factor negative regulatory protein n=1 Tax=Hydrogenophaga sp. BPS33 TaxID=2651974 RepID=UPI00131FED80|nr:sigma-E factor negative regulatory protein [Hydrogenophaga sp. BPS33]QHE85109.1 sigma-E factor negative regulatory protein [Hydrogenophaga sp. BPS33]